VVVWRDSGSLQNVTEADVSASKHCDQSEFWSLLVVLLSKLRKITCDMDTFHLYLYSHQPSALRELVILRKNDPRQVFQSIPWYSVLKQLTHLTIKGAYSMQFSELLLLPNLEVFTVLTKATRRTVTDYSFTLDYTACKNLRTIRLCSYVFSLYTEAQYTEMTRLNPNISIEIVQ